MQVFTHKPIALTPVALALGVVVFGASVLGKPAHAENLDIPPEITPAIRAACEKDVRRLCVKSGSTRATVKSCVLRKFTSLNTSCQYRLITAGLVSKNKASKSALAKKPALSSKSGSKAAAKKSRGQSAASQAKANRQAKANSAAAEMLGMDQ